MANGRRDDNVITIEPEETEWLLHPSAGNKSCCIFRIPQCVEEIKTKAYQPHIVSIGPYHYGKQHLQMMEQHKGRYLRDLLARTSPIGPTLDDYMQAVESSEGDIRGSYSETINFCSHDLVKMMVLDGIFTIELFCKLAGLSRGDQADPIFKLAWVFPNLILDLLRLENQIPFFVLQILFDKSKPTRKDSQSSLANLALKFIKHAVGIPEEVVNQHFKAEAKHLLDLVRLSFIPQPSHPPQDKKQKNIPPPLVQLIQYAKKPLKRIKVAVLKPKELEGNTNVSSDELIQSATRHKNIPPPLVQLIQYAKKPLKRIKAAVLKPKELLEGNTNASLDQLIQSATRLHLSGIKFKTVKAMSFLDIRFHKGVLEIPKLSLDDILADLFLNFVGFEQCYFHFSKDIISYAAFMTCLIRTPADATFLCENNIIENYIGTDKEVANFFRNLGKDVPFRVKHSYLRNLFNDVNEYQKNIWHVRWAGFKFTYFDTPWSFLSALAAVILLLLTVLQAFYAVYAYYHPKQSG